MALVLKDRVKESTTTTGTGTITLAGAVSGFQSFAAVGDGNTTYYAIVALAPGEWEVGIGTYTASGTTLSRTTVLASSNSGSLVNFTSGTKDVFVTYPAEKSVEQSDIGTAPNQIPLNQYLGSAAYGDIGVTVQAYDANNTTASNTQTLTNKTISADDNTLSGIAVSSFVLSNASGNIDGSAAQKAIPSGVVVGTTDTQTLTNKTIQAGTFTNGYTEETVSANTSTAYTINLDNGSVQILTLTGNCTFTFPTATAGKGFTLLLKQDATGSRTVTWPAEVKWPSDTPPTITSTANKSDKYVFVADGTNWVASNAGQNYTM